MKSRWLSQMLWLENRAQQNRNRYYLLRLSTIKGYLGEVIKDKTEKKS